jgi:hypothetical protein
MTIDEFLQNLPEKAFDHPNFYFWIRNVIDAIGLLGPETERDLERYSRLLLDHHSGVDISEGVLEDIRHDIVRTRGRGFWRDDSVMGLKYRCLNAIASTRDQNLADLYDWQYGIVTAFQLINLDDRKDRALIDLIREHAQQYGVDLNDQNPDC